MKILLKSMIFILLIFTACSYSRFTITGVPYEPLPDESEIRVLPAGDLSRYDQIGIAEIKNSDKEYRIREAKRYARMYGGEAIMSESDEDSKVQRFRVLFPLHDDTVIVDEEDILTEEFVEPEEEEPVIVKIEEPPVKEKPDYSNLPVVPYKILIGEISNLKEEKFRTVLYPRKTMASPKELLPFIGRDILIELGTKKGDNIIYLITKRENVSRFKQGIELKKALRFVYTPVALYKSQYPVVRFIDFID